MSAQAVASKWVVGIDALLFVFILAPLYSPRPFLAPPGEKEEPTPTFGRVYKQGKYKRRGTLKTKINGDSNLVPRAVMRRRVAQGQTEQGWRCLSEASLARPRLHRATQCARRADESGSPSFAYFSWRSKKSECAVGRITRHTPPPSGAKPGLTTLISIPSDERTNHP